MAIRSFTHCVVFVLAAIPALANAAKFPFDGRLYEVVVVANGLTWAAANTAANGMTCTDPICAQNGLSNVAGHLATIGTFLENKFIQDTFNHPTGNRTELWIGGFQQSGAAEPGGGWQWVNGDSIPVPNPIANPPSQTFGWLPGEPSNGPGGAEQHLTFGRGGLAGWNDNDKTNNIWGYVVEYGDKLAPKLADDCALNATDVDGPGCPLGLNGTVITLPLKKDQIDDDVTFTISTQLIKNDTGRCERGESLRLNDAVIVPAYLCGHPDFLVAKVETNDPDPNDGTFEINQGVVDVLNDDNVLDGNLYECVPSGVDPTEADVVGYQSSQNMLEAGFTMGIPQDLVGSVGEFTTLCGTSRGTVPGRSWYFAGLRIFPGVGNDAVSNLAGNRAFRFRLLTYKLDVMALAVSKACDDTGPKAYTKGVCSSLDSQIKVLKGDIANGNDTEAKAHAKNFEKTLRGAKLTVIPGENNDGELTSRIKNFNFTLAKFFP